jgi:hypothetical protein
VSPLTSSTRPLGESLVWDTPGLFDGTGVAMRLEEQLAETVEENASYIVLIVVPGNQAPNDHINRLADFHFKACASTKALK